MMPWSLLLNPTVLLGIALAGTAGFGWLQTIRLGAAQDRVEVIQARFDLFATQVASEGKLAKERAENQAKADKLRKEKVDAMHKAAVSLRDQRIASLRHDLDNRGTYALPAASPGSSSPNLACFDRSEFGRAGRVALEGLRAIADKGDAATLDLNTAKEWAIGR